MLQSILLDVTVVVLALTIIGLIGIVGTERLQQARPYVIDQIRHVFPYLLLLGGVLLINDYLRDFGPTLSWIFGWNITGMIMSIEGSFIATMQSYSHPWLTSYFSYIYIYGYIFLLVFPIAAYLFHTDSRPVRELAIAYTFNYGIGVICYLLFIAFGPRNTLVDAEGLLYLYWPESQILTSEVNANVNVFPSLHASLSATVAILAFRWRDVYRAWFPIAAFGAASVAVSTMYLGIHWATDVVAGFVLAGICVGLAIWLTRPERTVGRLGRFGVGLRRPIDRRFDYLLAVVLGNRELRPDSTRQRSHVGMETTVVSAIIGIWIVLYFLLGAGLQTELYQALTAEDPTLSIPLVTGAEYSLAYGMLGLGLAYVVGLLGLQASRWWGWWLCFALAGAQTAGFALFYLFAVTSELFTLVMLFASLYVLLALWDEQGPFEVRLGERMPKFAARADR